MFDIANYDLSGVELKPTNEQINEFVNFYKADQYRKVFLLKSTIVREYPYRNVFEEKVVLLPLVCIKKTDFQFVNVKNILLENTEMSRYREEWEFYGYDLQDSFVLLPDGGIKKVEAGPYDINRVLKPFVKDVKSLVEGLVSSRYQDCVYGGSGMSLLDNNGWIYPFCKYYSKKGYDIYFLYGYSGLYKKEKTIVSTQFVPGKNLSFYLSGYNYPYNRVEVVGDVQDGFTNENGSKFLHSKFSELYYQIINPDSAPYDLTQTKTHYSDFNYYKNQSIIPIDEGYSFFNGLNLALDSLNILKMEDMKYSLPRDIDVGITKQSEKFHEGFFLGTAIKNSM